MPNFGTSLVALASIALVSFATASLGQVATASTAPPASGEVPTGTEAAFSRTVESALGTATIEAPPQRVVALGWTDMDIAVALGVIPVGVAEAPGTDEGMYPWLAAALEGVEPPARLDTLSAGIPIEQVAALDPDLILAVNQYVEDDYDKLTAIAPVVSYVEDPWGEDWRSHAAQIARGLGREDALADLLDETDELVEATASEHPEFDGATFTFSAHRDGGFDLIDRPDVPVVEFMGDLGFELPPDLVDPDSPYSRSVGVEQVDLLEADAVVVWTPEPDALRDDAVFQSILPAAADDRVIYIDDLLAQGLNSPTALSIPYTLDRLIPQLAATFD